MKGEKLRDGTSITRKFDASSSWAKSSNSVVALDGCGGLRSDPRRYRLGPLNRHVQAIRSSPHPDAILYSDIRFTRCQFLPPR